MKSDFLTYQAQTSSHPLLLEIKKAKGSYIYDKNYNYLLIKQEDKIWELPLID